MSLGQEWAGLLERQEGKGGGGKQQLNDGNSAPKIYSDVNDGSNVEDGEKQAQHTLGNIIKRKTDDLQEAVVTFLEPSLQMLLMLIYLRGNCAFF